MNKDKPSKSKVKGVPNKHLHARTTFLYQAATYLTLHSGLRPAASSQVEDFTLDGPSSLALELGSQMHTVSRKGQVRLSAELKRSICKCCNTILIPGRTATQTIENDSKGGKKPWADILVIACTSCGSIKRFPVGARRQKRKTERSNKAENSTSRDACTSTRSTSPALQTTTDQSPALVGSITPSSIT
jgi:ribonuclease P protein subunit RPR2